MAASRAILQWTPRHAASTTTRMVTGRVGMRRVMPVITTRSLNTDTAPVLYSAHAKVVGARTGWVFFWFFVRSLTGPFVVFGGGGFETKKEKERQKLTWDFLLPVMSKVMIWISVRVQYLTHVDIWCDVAMWWYTADWIERMTDTLGGEFLQTSQWPKH